MFGLVGHVGGKMLANHAVPVRRILFIEEILDVFRNSLLSFVGIDGSVYLLFDILEHLVVHLCDDLLQVSFRHAGSF